MDFYHEYACALSIFKFKNHLAQVLVLELVFLNE